jgi:acetate kinase
VLGGCDAILVGGGAGERAPLLRERLFTGLESLGITLDGEANARAQAPAAISPATSPVQVHVIPTDEESVLADEACGWLARASSASDLLEPARTS